MIQKELHFYSNKIKAFFLLVISSIIIVFGFIGWNRVLRFSYDGFENTLFLLIYLLFIFGFFLGLYLLFRKKPLLSINNNQIIVYDIFRQPIFLNLKEIKSFELFQLTIQFSTNSEILIELKNPSTKVQSSLYYSLLKRFSLKIANTRYSIKLQFIKANREELMEILNQKLKSIS